MSLSAHPRTLTGFRFVARRPAAVILISGLVFAGWAFDIETMKRLHPRDGRHEPRWHGPGLPPGRSVALDPVRRGRPPPPRPRDGLRRRGRPAGAVPARGYLGGLGLRPGPASVPGQARSGGPAARAIPTGWRRTRRRRCCWSAWRSCSWGEVPARLAGRPVLALTAALIALLAIIGYAYSALPLAGIEQFIPMALNTALALAPLSGGILCARPERGVMAVVSSDGAGGVMARRLLPAVIVIPGGRGLAALARPASRDCWIR